MTSLISRQGCIFPYSFLESILASHDEHQWNFFDLCGCPQSLVISLVQLAHLAAEKQKASSMQSVVFDTTLVSDIETSLESWCHSFSRAGFQDEESMQQYQDAMHCSEAWRHGLLLYIYRVFRWNPGMQVPVHVAFRARVVLDHVFACRDDGFVARQALLPLFFAGCELKDPSSRTRITDFCTSWSQRTGYLMFNTAIPLLEELWADQEMRGFDYVWWGQIVDTWHSTSSDQSLPLRITFG